MIMIMKSLKCSSTLFLYSNLCDLLPNLYCDSVLTYNAYIVIHYLIPDILHRLVSLDT